MPPHITNTFTISGVKHRKHKEPKDVWLLRPLQQEIASALEDHWRRRILAATGSGKSIAMQWLACGDHQAGFKVVVTFPKLDILAGFAKSKTIKDPRTGERRVWDPIVITGKNTVQRLVDHLRSGSTRPVLCTSATWLCAQKQLTDEDLAKVSLFIDESHHLEAEGDESSANRLHDSTMRVMRLGEDQARVTLATATWLRSEGSDVLTDDELQGFVTYHLPLTRYLQEVAEIERVHFTFALASEEESLKLSLGEGRPMMYFARSGQSPSTKLKANRKVVKAAKAAGRTVLDLVDDRDPQARAAKLRAFDKSEQARVDFVTALYMGNEGFDWPRAQEAFFARPRRSLRSMVQMIGRVLRYQEGKTDVYITICIPFEAKDEKIKKYFDVLIATAVLSCQFAEVSIAPRSPGGPHAPRSEAWKLLHDESFLLGVFPKLEAAVMTGATDVELYGMLRKVQRKYPVLEDTAVRGDLVSLLRQSLGGGVASGQKDKNEAQCLNVPGADQIENPIVLERISSLLHNVEVLSGKATQDALERVRLKRRAAYDPADGDKWVQIAQDNQLTSPALWVPYARTNSLPTEPWAILGITCGVFFGLVNGQKSTKAMSNKERVVLGRKCVKIARKQNLNSKRLWVPYASANGLPTQPHILLGISIAAFFAEVNGRKSTRTMTRRERQALGRKCLRIARKENLTSPRAWYRYARENDLPKDIWRLLEITAGEFFGMVRGTKVTQAMSGEEREAEGQHCLSIAIREKLSNRRLYNDYASKHKLRISPWHLLGISEAEFFSRVRGKDTLRRMNRAERLSEAQQSLEAARKHKVFRSTHWPKLARALRLPSEPWRILGITTSEFFALVREDKAEAAE